MEQTCRKPINMDSSNNDDRPVSSPKDRNFKELQKHFSFLDKNELDAVEPLKVVTIKAKSYCTSVAPLEQFSMLGRFLQSYRSINVKKIELEDCNLYPMRIKAMFGREGKTYKCCSLETLVLVNNDHLEAAGIYAMVPFLKKMAPTLKCLNLRNTRIDEISMEYLVEAFDEHYRRHGSNNNDEDNVIQEFNFSENNLGNEGVRILLSSSVAKRVEKLVIRERRLSINDYEAIENFLKDGDRNKLRELRLQDGEIANKEITKRLITSIPNNSALRGLYTNIANGLPSMFIMEMASLLQDKICNISSVESIRQSNHNLVDFGHKSILKIMLDPVIPYPPLSQLLSLPPPLLARALHINKEIQIHHEKIRCKLFTFYFRGDYDISSFLAMEPSMMPFVLAKMANPAQVCSTTSTHSNNTNNNITTTTTAATDNFTNSNTSTTPTLEEIPATLQNLHRLIRNWNLPTLFTLFSPDALRIKLHRAQKEHESLKRRVKRLEAVMAVYQTGIDEHGHKDNGGDGDGDGDDKDIISCTRKDGTKKKKKKKQIRKKHSDDNDTTSSRRGSANNKRRKRKRKDDDQVVSSVVVVRSGVQEMSPLSR